MQRDPNILVDGVASVEKGMNSGKAPNLLQHNEPAYLENITVRGGFAQTRPGFRQLKMLYYDDAYPQDSLEASYNATVNAFRAGKFQGARFYDDGTGRGALAAQVDGHLYMLQFQGNQLVIGDISITGDLNPSVFARVYMEQVEEFLIVQDGQTKPLIFNGAVSRRSDFEASEIPIGTAMAYGQGRLWVAQGRRYVGGDLSTGPNGPLKFTENAYILEGGAFVVPLQAGNISGMAFSAQLDRSLGQGDLDIFCPDMVFANTVPINRDDWASQQTPLQSILNPTSGGVSHWSISLVNADVFFRSKDGIRTISQVRSDFTTSWTNVPVSNEMTRVLNLDSLPLIKYTNAIVFDNRLLMSCLPRPLPNNCYFQGIIALDFHLISGMKERLPPSYDGIWTGLDTYQLVKGRFNGIERAFAFARSMSFNFVDKIVLNTATSHGDNAAIAIIGDGQGAEAEFRYGLDGSTFDLIPAMHGTGYAEGDIILLEIPSAEGEEWPAKCRVTVVNPDTSINTATLIDSGRYSFLPFLNPLITQRTTNGSGSGAQFFGPSQMIGIEVTNPGHGYTTTPTLLFTDVGPDIEATVYIDKELEVWEISKDEKFDYPINADNEWEETVITSIIETPSFAFAGQGRSNGALAKRLDKGRVHVDRVTNVVDFTLQYRPDQNPCWVDWHSWQVRTEHCATIVACDTPPLMPQEQYRPRMSIGQPLDTDTDPSSNFKARYGREFQARLQWQGFCRLKLLELKAYDIQEEVNPPIVETETTTKEVNCTC